MKDFNHLQEEIEQSFRTYFDALLSTSGIPRKYFYWNEEFLLNEDNLKFEYFGLDVTIKEVINHLGKFFFESEDVYFNVNKNSHRHDITINNFAKLFDDKNKEGQTSRYEYIKEYIFWQLLIQVKDEYQKELNNLSKEHSINQDQDIANEIRQLEMFKNVVNKVIPIQKRNFLYTYVQYSTKTGKRFRNPSYVHFTSLNQYQEIQDKVELIPQKEEANLELLKRIETLYVHKDFKDKMHFIFSVEGVPDKEELRELLDLMGQEGYGDYFRGQADASWILDSSIKREPKILDFEAEMYYDILSLKPEAFKEDFSVYERLITKQHFGMPTRLLDISRNPLIAIFFACNNLLRVGSDGLIYCFKPNEKVKLLHFEDDKLQALNSIYKKEKADSNFLLGISFLKGLAKNQRINNQSGDFIFVGDGEDVLEDLNNLPLKHIVIDSFAKEALLEQLESMNIHGGTVYPDLTHVSRYILEKYKKESKLNKAIEVLPGVEKSIEKQVDIPVGIDKENFWSTSTMNSFNELLKDYNLNNEYAKEQINYYLDEGDFQDYKLIRIMKQKPSLENRESARQNLKSLLSDFIKEQL